MCVFETYNRVYVYCLYCPYWNYNNQCRHTVKIPMTKHIVCIMSYLKIKNTMMCVVLMVCRWLMRYLTTKYTLSDQQYQTLRDYLL